MYYPAEYVLLRVRLGLRRVLREMLVCAGVIAILLLLLGRNIDLGTGIIGGLIFCPLLWLGYKLFRFVVGY